ncbi:MAG: hypothetical protein SH868_12000 [Bythopirellula sp.]|nr:hypothetical protein [Bythopirellula sp.]
MTASAPTAWQLDSDKEHFSPRCAATLVIGVLVTLYAVALLLVARRMMGAFTAELSWTALLVTALTAFAATTGARILWRRTFPEPIVGDQWIGWGASLTLVLFAAGLSFPGNHERDWFIWLPLLICDQLLRHRLFNSSNLKTLPAKTLALRLSGEQLQQIVRLRGADGHETIHATLRADFQAGQRHATVYVGFCPPLASMPEIVVEPSTGSAAEFKIVQAFAHGARIDVRLAQVAIEQTSLVLNLVAKEVSPPSSP